MTDPAHEIRFEVEAAGGVLWRVVDGVVQVALVHRPKYGDWTFPKGKLDPGESHERAAIREVEEETGLRGSPGHELPPTLYTDGKGRSKRVRYWEMTVADGEFVRNQEVDLLRWLDLPAASEALTYAHDGVLLAEFARFAGASISED